jgi:hypothetical protein
MRKVNAIVKMTPEMILICTALNNKSYKMTLTLG